MMGRSFVRTAHEPDLPPPPGATGLFALWRERLFTDATTATLTLLGLALVAWAGPGLIRFLVVDAVWVAADGKACAVPGAGGCWA